MRNRSSQLDVSHSLSSDLRLGDLYAAAVADNPLVADSLVLPAVALPVLHRSEDPLAEQAVLFRLERSVVDGFRLGYFTMRPFQNLFRRCQTDFHRFEII